MDVVAVGDAVDVDGCGAEGDGVAGWCGVDFVLDEGGVEHGEGGDPEAEDDSVDGREGDLSFAEVGVDETVDDGDEEDDGKGVEVLDQIVGDAVAGHLAGLGDEVAAELSVH